jgi:hypothetical protein
MKIYYQCNKTVYQKVCYYINEEVLEYYAYGLKMCCAYPLSKYENDKSQDGYIEITKDEYEEQFKGK